jgi:hypothetical protein
MHPLRYLPARPRSLVGKLGPLPTIAPAASEIHSTPIKADAATGLTAGIPRLASLLAARLNFLAVLDFLPMRLGQKMVGRKWDKSNY